MLQQALQAMTSAGERDLDAIMEALITNEVVLLGINTTDEEEPQLLQLEVADSTHALALFSSEIIATQLASQLMLECQPVSVAGYWPFIEIDEVIPLIIDPGLPHNLVLPAEVVVSLRPVIRALLEDHS